MSRSDYDERAAKNRAAFPLLFAALEEVRQIFGDDCKLICGVGVDGKSVGREPQPGYFIEERKKLESR